MPIIIIKKGALSKENKTLPEKPPEKPSQSNDVIPAPFIDKISIVVTITDPEEAHHIYQNTLNEFKDATVFKSSKGIWGPYKAARRVALAGLIDQKKWPLLQYAFDANKKMALGFRTEFSPVDLGPLGLDQYHAQLASLMPSGWAYIIAHGSVTMVEVSVDFAHVTVEDFHVLPQQGPSAMTWKTDGHLETVVLGKVNGNQTRIYDRGKKWVAKGQKWSGPPTTRVERILRLQPARPLTSLVSLTNPFSHLTMVANVPGPPPEEQKAYIWNLFTDSVAVRGLSTALKLLPPAKRTIYRNWLALHPTPWWDPEAIWQKWPSMLHELMIASSADWPEC